MALAYFGIGTYRHLPYKIEADGKYYYQYLVSGFYDHDFDFTNNYRQPKYKWMATELDHYLLRDMVNPETHRPVNLFSTGVAILWTPFFVVVYTLANLLSWIGFDIDLNPWSKFFQYGVMLSSLFFAWLTLRMFRDILQQYFDKQVLVISLILVVFLSPFFYYAAIESSMSHIYDVFSYTLLLWLIFKARQENYQAGLWKIGMAAALCILVRTQNAPTIALLGLMLWFDYYQVTKRWVSVPLFVALFAFLVSIAPFPLTNLYLFGKLFAVPQGSHFMLWGNPQLLNVWFSWRNGFFSYHPLLLVGLVGYVGWVTQMFRQHHPLRYWWLTLLVAFLVQSYINACVIDWWAGHSFGQRRLLSSLPLFVVGIGNVIAQLRKYSPVVFNKYSLPVSLGLSSLGIYLMLIHIYIWNYEDPHNIYEWMVYTAPVKILTYFGL